MVIAAAALLAAIVALSDVGGIYGAASRTGVFQSLFLFFLLLSLQAALASPILRLVGGRTVNIPKAHILVALLLVPTYVTGIYSYVAAPLERYAYLFLLVNFGPDMYTYVSVLVSMVAMAVLAVDLVMRTVQYEAGHGSLLVAAVPLLTVAVSTLFGIALSAPHAYVEWYIYASPLVALASPLNGLATHGVSRPLYPINGLVLRLPSRGSVRGLVGSSVLLGSAAITAYHAFLLFGQRWGLDLLWAPKYAVFIPLLLGYVVASRRIRAVPRSLMVCPSCGRATLSYLPRCQHCGADPA